MKCNVYAIYDPDGGYLMPFVAPDDRRAISAVLYSVLQEEPDAVKPFELVRVGRFNSETGRLSGLPPVKGVSPQPVMVYSFSRRDFEIVRKEFQRDVKPEKEATVPCPV